jgi:hypothetical protein
MPFGKHKGENISDISDNYLEWILEQEWTEEKYPQLIAAIGIELTNRAEQGGSVDEAGNREADDLPWSVSNLSDEDDDFYF